MTGRGQQRGSREVSYPMCEVNPFEDTRGPPTRYLGKELDTRLTDVREYG